VSTAYNSGVLALMRQDGSYSSLSREDLIDAFLKNSEGLEKSFEARTHKSDWVMPYRLFRPQDAGKLPLVVYLHGSGGLGDDNEKQLQLGNIFGTRVWLLPENQKRFPCYVVVTKADLLNGFRDFFDELNDATAAQQRTIGRVDDCIDGQRGDVGLQDRLMDFCSRVTGVDFPS